MLPFMAVGALMMFLSIIFIFIFPASQGELTLVLLGPDIYGFKHIF